MATVTQEGVMVENLAQLGTHPLNTEVPYIFKGKNLNAHAMKVRPKPSCGCTTASGEFEVQPGEEFEVKGHYKGSATSTRFTKTIGLYYGRFNTEDTDKKIQLTFSGEIKP